MILVPTILCGGAGARLWPVSREQHPKPFMQLADGQSLLQKAYLRGAGLPGAASVLTVTNRDLLFKVRDEFRALGAQLRNDFLLEPCARNTAASIAAAALHVSATLGDDAILLVLPADHVVEDQEAFAQAVQQAVALAGEGRLVTFGIRPDHPETGYGYIEANGTEVVRFVEKPVLDVAREYVASGRFLWNAGMFCFRAGSMLSAMVRFCPDILAATRDGFADAHRSEGSGSVQLEFTAGSFSRIREDSIDYAVMEKAAHEPGTLAVVCCDIGWSDIGSWASVAELTAADADGNRVVGDAWLHDVRGCYVNGGNRVVAAVGVQDLLIVDTSDALLVAHRDHAQDVKHIYNRLKADNNEVSRLHRTVQRPWGTFTVLENGPGYKIKRIDVKPGQTLSLQMHHHRNEHWIVVHGMARVTRDDDEFLVCTNESTYIKAGHRHRLENPGIVDLVMIEVQVGEYLGEDDIVRFEDRYGRAG